MTQQEKHLLLKDLCARLPYGVQVKIEGYIGGILKGVDGGTISTDSGINYPLRLVKPYLRPMSSMTEEEDKEWQLYKNNIACSCDENLNERINELHAWFNKKGFDYRGLIEKSLALKATKNMYKN